MPKIKPYGMVQNPETIMDTFNMAGVCTVKKYAQEWADKLYTY
jgi:hypothetical protein